MNSDTITCTNCGAKIHWLDVFPGNICLTCHAAREESKPLPTAKELADMFRKVVQR